MFCLGLPNAHQVSQINLRKALQWLHSHFGLPGRNQGKKFQSYAILKDWGQPLIIHKEMNIAKEWIIFNHAKVTQRRSQVILRRLCQQVSPCLQLLKEVYHRLFTFFLTFRWKANTSHLSGFTRHCKLRTKQYNLYEKFQSLDERGIRNRCRLIKQQNKKEIRRRRNQFSSLSTTRWSCPDSKFFGEGRDRWTKVIFRACRSYYCREHWRTTQQLIQYK